MYRVFEHSQVVLSSFQCMYVIHEASLRSHELYCDDPNRLLLGLDRHQLQLKLNYLLQLLSCQPNIFRYTLILRHSIIPGRERESTFFQEPPLFYIERFYIVVSLYSPLRKRIPVARVLSCFETFETR